MGTLRLLLALAVVVTHAGVVFGAEWTRMTGGVAAVQLFYMISGFYMALVLSEKYRVAEGRPGTLKLFYTNRVMRLLPTYWVVAGLTLGAGLFFWVVSGEVTRPIAGYVEHGASLTPLAWVALALSQVFMVGQDWLCFAAIDPASGGLYLTSDYKAQAVPAFRFMLDPPAWTIGVELTFYLFAPWLVRQRTAMLAGLCVGSLGLRALAGHAWGLDENPWTYRFFPFELAMFLMGMLAYRGYAVGRAAGLWRGPWVRRGCVAVWALAVVSVVGHRWLPWGGAIGEAIRGGTLLPVYYFVFPLLMVPVFVATKRWRWDRAIGELSYPVYISHSLVIVLVETVGGAWALEQIGLVTVTCSLGAAAALNRWVEQPMDAIRQRRAARVEAADKTGTAAPGRASNVSDSPATAVEDEGNARHVPLYRFPGEGGSVEYVEKTERETTKTYKKAA